MKRKRKYKHGDRIYNNNPRTMTIVTNGRSLRAVSAMFLGDDEYRWIPRTRSRRVRVLQWIRGTKLWVFDWEAIR